jgi:hypothetical protein
MLSVAKPTLSPKEGEGDRYMESEDIVCFLDSYDEDNYQKPY